jgi:hypothetical protein
MISDIIIFSVSLSVNIPTLKISIPIIFKLYDPRKYVVIVPDAQFNEFLILKSINDKIELIKESHILDYIDFEEIRVEYNLVDSDSKNRSKWYYQQALKIAYPLINHNGNHNFIMIDADTIILKKINFFKNHKSKLYGSLLESHSEYYETLSAIFKREITSKMGFTTQFFSCTPSEIDNLVKLLSKFIAPCEKHSVAKWVSRVILKSCKMVHGTLVGSKFSEQELFGFSNQIASQMPQSPIIYFRTWGLHFNLNIFTLFLIKSFGFKHLTFEMRDNNTPSNPKHVLKNIIYLYYIQIKSRFK